MPMISIVKSQKNADQIIFDNYIYEKKRVLTNHISWRCTIKSCSSTAVSVIDYMTNLSSFRILSQHNHAADTIISTKKIALEKMKEMVVTTNSSPRNIVFRVLRGENDEIIRAMGPLDNIYRCLRYHRLKFINPPPFQYDTLKLSEQLCKTHTLNNFYQYGLDNYGNLEGHDGILLFFSTSMATKLINNHVWAVDGTFAVVPSPYMQLYTISYIKEHHVFPCIFAILKNKREDTYRAMFNILRRKIGQAQPSIIKTDYESAAINAISYSFPNARISGCMFHLGQAIMRKLGELHLKSLYQTSNYVKKYVKALSSLTFVRADQVENTFNLLMSSAGFPVCLLPVYEYFHHTFISQTAARYPLSIWHSRNLNDRSIPRTNNAAEGWHNTFKDTFGTSKYSFHLLVQKLKDEEDVVRIRSLQMDVFGHNFERKRKYVELEDRLFSYLEANYQNEMGLEFLFGLVDLLFY